MYSNFPYFGVHNNKSGCVWLKSLHHLVQVQQNCRMKEEKVRGRERVPAHFCQHVTTIVVLFTANGICNGVFPCLSSLHWESALRERRERGRERERERSGALPPMKAHQDSSTQCVQQCARKWRRDLSPPSSFLLPLSSFLFSSPFLGKKAPPKKAQPCSRMHSEKEGERTAAFLWKGWQEQ